ncbi:MAG TPA: glycosyltransferase family 2 protein [Chitinophagaceae bacterium]|nr:glycosyltransferase family 2 protein [Chitinophagaceae bacterium]
MRSKVSVLIPTYNYAHFLDEAIQSVLSQTYQNFELIIIDDGSKDNTDEVVKKYLTDGRVRYLKNDVNIGLVGNWNRCLSLATGDYIKYLCADDKFDGELLEKFVEVMERYNKVSLVVCARKSLGNPENTVKLPFKYLQSGKTIIADTLNNKGWLGEPSAVMFRRRDLAVGNFRPDVIWLPDWEMWLRLLNVGDCYIIPEPLVYVRIHAGQLTKKVIRNFTNYFEEYYLCKAIKERNGYNIDVSSVDMEKVVKKKAINCAKVMVKILPQITHKERRKLFVKALKIAFAENIPWHVFLFYVKNKFTKPARLQNKQA